MKTQRYNPSPLEVEFAKAISELKNEIQEYLTDNTIVNIKADLEADNPQVNIELQDQEGDKHEMVIKIIQRIDTTG